MAEADVAPPVDGAEERFGGVAPELHPPLEERPDGGEEGHQPLLAALAHHPDGGGLGIDVVHVKRHEFGPTGARQVGQADHRRIPDAGGSLVGPALPPSCSPSCRAYRTNRWVEDNVAPDDNCLEVLRRAGLVVHRQHFVEIAPKVGYNLGLHGWDSPDEEPKPDVLVGLFRQL